MTTTPTAVGVDSVSQSQPGYDGERAASANAEPSAVLAALIELERWVTEDSDCRTQAQRAAGRKALIAARAAIANSYRTQPVPAAKSESHNHSEKGTADVG